MPVSIREATCDDVPAILAIERSAASGAHWTEDQYKNRIRDGYVLVARQGIHICGFLCARVVAGEWELENIVVKSECRRSGVGIALMRTLLSSWEATAGSVIVLEVRKSNVAARALYEKSGFRQVGHRRAYYRDPVEDAILYARQRET